MFRKGFFRSKRKNAINEVEVYDNPNDWQKLRSVLFDEVLKVCLDPEELAARLAYALFRKTGRSYGYVHFHFQNKSDHIILFWAKAKWTRYWLNPCIPKKGNTQIGKILNFLIMNAKISLKSYTMKSNT